MKTWQDERGQITAFVAVTVLSLLVCAGLVLDGGRLLTARREASDIAEAAARAGAQAVSIESLRRDGAHVLDAAAAVTAAEQYLAAAGWDGTATVVGDEVTVSVTTTAPMAILGIIGLSERTVTGTETARTVRGLIEGET